MANAEEIIKKANYDPELKSYTDSKYVKTAGNILWCGCLVALDATLQLRDEKAVPPLQNTKKLLANEIRNCFIF